MRPNHWATLKRDTLPDDYSGDAATVTTVLTAWVELIPLTGREFADAQLINADIRHKIRLPYVSDVTHDCYWELEDGRVFNIAQPPINLKERSKTLEMLAIEVH